MSFSDGMLADIRIFHLSLISNRIMKNQWKWFPNEHKITAFV